MLSIRSSLELFMRQNKERLASAWFSAALLLLIVLTLASGAQAQNGYVYVNNQTLTNNVSAYSVSSTGGLSPVSGSPFSTVGKGSNVTCFGLDRITVNAANKLLFVANTGDQTVTVFQINPADGTLTTVAGSPFATGLTLDSCQGISLAATPDGRFLFASSNGKIQPFTVAANGVLAPLVTTAHCCSPVSSMIVAPMAGTYPIIPSADPSPALSNYSVSLINGTLTVQ